MNYVVYNLGLLFRRVRSTIKPYDSLDIWRFVQKSFKEQKGYELLPFNEFYMKTVLYDNAAPKDVFFFKAKVNKRKYPLHIKTDDVGDIIDWKWITPPGWVKLEDVL